jgi:tetratricopeptide (TPR) repeat protein
LCGDEQASALISHAAQCESCGLRLRDLMAAVSGEPLSAEEEALVNQTPADWPGKRRELTAQMARRHGKGPRWWVPIAAALVIGLGIGGWALGRWWSQPPLAQLAQAYSARRNLELRIPGADYAPLRIERGPIGSIGDLPSALLQSQARIKEHLDKRPDDPEWLHAQGRAALLLWDFDGAMRSLQAAADLGAKSPAFLVDFGIAYYERAERNGSSLDYALALEKFGQALRQDPRNLAALYNRAIVEGKLLQYDAAIADLEAFLRRETDARWKEEARGRLERLRNRRAGLFGPSPGAPRELRTESALESAMVGGLASSPDNTALAAGLFEEHGDPWLREAMASPDFPARGRALEALAALARVRVAAGGSYGTLTDAIHFLQSARLPAPLRVWRDYELLYRTTRTPAVAECGNTAVLAQGASLYPWFEAQIWLESSLCAAGRQDFVGAETRVDQAVRIAETHRFAATLIRIPNFRGQRLVDAGFCREAVQTATEALARMESGGYPIRRAYDFQVIVLRAAAQLNLPYTAHGAAGMMAATARAAGARMLEGTAESLHAQYALAIGLPDEAASAFAAAELAFQALGNNPDAAAHRRATQAGWLEVHQDRASLYQRLAEARANGSGIENLYFNRKLIASLCRLELQAGNSQAVEQLAEPFLRAIFIGAGSSSTPPRAYLSEIAAVSRAQVHARLLAGQSAPALSAWHRYLAIEQRLLGGRPGDAEGAPLDPGTAILTVADLDGPAAIWWTTRSGTQFHWAPEPYAKLIEDARRLRRLTSLSAVPETRIVEAAGSLYGVLFAAGTDGLQHVLLEARGELAAVPLTIFSLLREGEHADFSYLPYRGGLTAKTGPGHMTLIAATQFDAKFGGRLPALDEEVEAAAGAFPDHAVLRAGQATARAVDAAATTPGVLHFAGHAIPWRGGIGLVVAPDPQDAAADGRSGVWSLAGPKPVKASLVVFSACRTGEFNEPGTVQPGQLSEAALLAGAGEVVGTLWDVDSAATAAWMRLFYRQLSAGSAVPAALRRASLELRSTAAWSHPRYWAGFAAYTRGVPAEPLARAAGTVH